MNRDESLRNFVEARYGLFIHFGLYSQLARGEWVMNREGISPEEMRLYAKRFDPCAFDAEAIADLAVQGGMKYLVFTTMHHEGFRMYHSDLTDFCSTKAGPSRDFVREIIDAARPRGLKVGLYHSLNNWFDKPDTVSALENREDYGVFIDKTMERIKELVTRYNPIDILWYDGWWPFDADGWRAREMNDMVGAIQPNILLNGRNGLAGDFSTPERHLQAPRPWRPWEACITMNDNWGYHAGDRNWKQPVEIIKMLVCAAQGRGNLLLNVGLRGDGGIPEEAMGIARAVGEWLGINGECIYGTDLWTFDPHERGNHRGDWSHHGLFTVKGNNFYFVGTSMPEDRLVIDGITCLVSGVCLLGGSALAFEQRSNLLVVDLRGVANPRGLPMVLRVECDRAPAIYKTGGMSIPAVRHPRYDPIKSNINW